MKNHKLPWIIQIQFTDKRISSCPMHVFRRKFAGTGVEVDRSYEPVRVAPGRFVGRGFATARAAARVQSSVNFWIPAKPRPPHPDYTLSLFQEIRVQAVRAIAARPVYEI